MLSNEARHAPYSSCWSSVVNYHLAEKCQKNNIPFLPIDMHLFRQDGQGSINVAAPTRQLVASRGTLGQEARLRIGTEIMRYQRTSSSMNVEMKIVTDLSMIVTHQSRGWLAAKGKRQP